MLPLGALAWQACRLGTAVRRGRGVARQARAFEAHPPGARVRVLLVGDSTGVGVGAGCPESTLPGLLAAEFPEVQIVNRCRNGARVADAARQLEPLRAAGEHYDLALLLVGGNDVIRMTPHGALRRDAQALLQGLQGVARRTVWLGSANLGGAPLLRLPLSGWLRWWLDRRTGRTMQLLAQQARAHGAAFIDFFQPRRHDLFARQAGIYFAADGLHPSAASYRHCFEQLRRRVPLHRWLGHRPAALSATQENRHVPRV